MSQFITVRPLANTKDKSKNKSKSKCLYDIDNELNLTLRRTTLKRIFNIGLLQEHMRTHMFRDLCSIYNIDAVTCKMFYNSNDMECILNGCPVKKCTRLKHDGLVLLRTTTVRGGLHNFVLSIDRTDPNKPIGYIFDPNGTPIKRIFEYHIKNLQHTFSLEEIITFNGPNFNQNYPHLKQINHIRHKGYCFYINYYILYLILRMKGRTTPLDVYAHICKKFKTQPKSYHEYLFKETEKIVCYALDNYY